MIRRTFDTGLVRRILSDKEIHERIGSAVPIEAYNPETQEEIYYLSVEDEGSIIGLVVFHIFNHPVCFQGHVNYLPEYWGNGLDRHTGEAIRWMFENTDCRKVVALIPDDYPEILVHAKRAGMNKEGYLTNSIICNGVLQGQTMIGIEK